MNEEQERYLDELQKLNSATKNLGKQLQAITPEFYSFDFFLITALNRTVNLNKAFIELIKGNNFIAGAPLVRINLDTLLRLYAGRVSNLDMNEFARKVIFEKRKINNLKSTERNEKGKLKEMSDNFLKKSISQINGYEWVEKVYDAGNSFIHLDSKLFFSSTQVNDKKDKTINLTIGYHDSYVEQSEKTGATFWMQKITEGIIGQAMLWIAEKAKAFDFDIEKLNDIENLKN